MSKEGVGPMYLLIFTSPNKENEVPISPNTITIAGSHSPTQENNVAQCGKSFGGPQAILR